MKASTLPRFLIGSRAAILEIAASRWSLACAILFVISAGFAREYDGEDLVHEPWHVLRPLAASLATGTILFLIVQTATINSKLRSGIESPPSPQLYRVFMTLFWMTAPLAWLYAIPYERFLSPVDAVSANLTMLAIVSFWRVLLITRVISVIYGVAFVPAWFLVMLFADIIVFFVVQFVEIPVIDVMGGIRHSARDQLIADTVFNLLILSFLTAPIWILGSLISLFFFKPKWPDLSEYASSNRSQGLIWLASVSVLVWAPVLFITQPEQMRRHEVESLLNSGQVEKALAVMSAHQHDDYPPQWEPPPRLGYTEAAPSMAKIQGVMEREWPAEWVAQVYLEKFRRQLFEHSWPFSTSDDLLDLVNDLKRYDDVDLDRIDSKLLFFIAEYDEALSDEERIAIFKVINRIEKYDQEKIQELE